MSRVFATLPEALTEIARLERLVSALYKQLTAKAPVAAATTAVETAPRKRAHTETALVMYTDGSSLGNGKAGARAGAAVTTNGGFVWQGRAPGAQTNNRAETYAAIVALAHARDVTTATLWTDSEYVMHGVRSWLDGWVRAGWKKKDGQAPLNVDLWRMVWALITERRERQLPPVAIEWVKAHNGTEGNEEVDKLAKAAAEMPLDGAAPFYPPFPGIDEVLKRANLA